MQKSIYTSIKVLFCIIILTSSSLSFAQEVKTKKPFRERIFAGGGLGFGFGSNSVMVDVSPIVGYALTDNFVMGIGFTYKYYQYNDYYMKLDDSSLHDLKNNIYGGSVFARYFLTGIGVPIIENMFLHAEVEPLIFQNDYTYNPNKQGEYRDASFNFYSNRKEQISITSYFLGGGLRQMVGTRSYLYIEVLWNFNEELYSPYDNPRIRIGFAAGF